MAGALLRFSLPRSTRGVESLPGAAPGGFRTGTRGVLLVFLLLTAPADVPAQTPAPAGSVPATSLQNAAGHGDFEFYLDAIGVRPGSAGRTLVRVLVQLPVRPFLVQTRADRAEVRLRARAFPPGTGFAALAGEEAAAATAPAESLAGEYARSEAALEQMLARFEARGDAAASAESRTRIEAPRVDLYDTDFRVIDLALELPAGDYVLQVVAENLSRTKRGILDRVRRRPLAAVARLLVRVPDLTREPGLADLGFELGHGARAPYPARLYGLLNDSLHVRTTLFAHGDYTLQAIAAGRDGETAWRDSLRVHAEGEREVALRTSVNTLAAGQYLLRVVATGPQGTVATARSFDVAWSMVTWAKPRRDLDLEAELALPEARFEDYRTLPVGEKEKYLEEFWQSLDPTPETAQNEVRDEFLRRVAVADLHYSESVPGSRTDRGRIYVHFGPPEELQADVLPTHLAGRGAEEALEKVDDVFVAAEHPKRDREPDVSGASRGSEPWERATAQQERNRLVGQAHEVTSYELWVYRGHGAPLFPEDKALTFDSSLRVLFVDLTGYGQYRLRKSSVRLDIRGLSPSF